MFTITEHHNPPYIEVVVFDRYPDQYRSEIEAVLIRYAEQYNEFCVLEVQHGKIQNALWSVLRTGGKVPEELLAAFGHLKRYAVVADEPGFLLKLIAALPRFGSAEIKLFKLHELDQARAWMKPV